MKIGYCMKTKVISTSSTTPIRNAVQTLIRNHIGTLPIVDEDSHLIGLVRMRDLIKLTMPDFAHLEEHVDYVSDFGAVEDQKPDPEMLNLPISEIMGEPIAVSESAGLVRAVALLQEHKMSDLPVIDAEKRLVGIASYVDIGVALMSNWRLSS